MDLPQLRVRTGYSYGRAYGRMPEVFERLNETGCKAAAIVDAGTWGHVRWEKEGAKQGIKTLFGMEVPIVTDESERDCYKPKAWILAENIRQFYRCTSLIEKKGGITPAEFSALQGTLRFAGGAAAHIGPESLDYLDINPASMLLAKQHVELARETGRPLVITSYNDMPDKSHERFAYAWKVRDSVGMRHIASYDELRAALLPVMTAAEFDKAIETTFQIAERLNTPLTKAPLIHFEGDLTALARKGMEYRLGRGHIESWTDEYEARFNEELEMIRLKEFESYFLVVSDLVCYAKDRNILVGPARGSSAGSLICYLLRITEVDPIPHQLLFARFIDVSRKDLPDIDIDFPDTKRHLIFEYLENTYGSDNVARIGNINTLKAASVLAHVGKKFNIGFHETSQVKNALIEYSSGDARYGKGLQDTMEKTTPGQHFSSSFPVAAECMGRLELHPSHSGVHAAGVIVCNEPVIEYCTVGVDGIAQIDKPDSEYLNLLKIDALGLRTLGVIEDCGVVTAEELYSLKLDDQAVFDILNEDRMGGIFQYEGQAVRSVAKFVHMDRFSRVDNVTALARPGPLASGMEHRYIARIKGEEPITYDVPELEQYISDTYGIFLYQEQIMFVVKEIGLFDWEKVSAIRKAMSGSKGEEYFNTMGDLFVKGATSQGIAENLATKIWKEIVTFGSWAFNKSHSVSYAIITYWTCWLKRYHQMDFLAACLRAAKDDVQTVMILRELVKEGVEYSAIDPERSGLNWAAVDGKLVGGIMNAKGYGPVKAAKYLAAREAGTLTDKQKEHLANAEVPYADLREAHSKFGHYYADPSLIGVTSGKPIVGMADVKDNDDALIICKLVKKVLADENEGIRVKKRGGKLYTKKLTQFLDIMCVDDSTDVPLRFRIRPEKYPTLGKPIFENAAKGDWFLVKGWKITGVPMFIVKNIKAIEP